jgi:hypothetical protein
MDELDDVLRERLIRLEASIEVPDRPRHLALSRRPRRMAAGVLAAVLVLGGAASASVLMDAQEAIPSPGVFSAGGALACTGVWKMTPPEAETYLASRGFGVTWQIEDVGAGTSRLSEDAPRHGYIIEGVLVGQALTLVVEIGTGARQANVSDC